MFNYKGDLWEHFGQSGHRIAISTNGYVKRNGEAVMGRGCAREATLLLPRIALALGRHIKTNGNVPGRIQVPNSKTWDSYLLIVLPVKHDWWEKASLELVQNSTNWLKVEASQYPDTIYHVPRLGCGSGRLDWATMVKPIMKALPDNVWVHY